MKPVHDLGNGPAHRPLGQLRPVDHEDRDTERPGRDDLRLGPGSARVLGDQQFRPVRAHQVQIILQPKRATCDDDLGVRQRKVPSRRIDQPGQEAVLREMREVGEMLTADRQEHPLAGTVQRRRGTRDVGNMGPVVLRCCRPRRPLESTKRHLGQGAGLQGIAADPGRKGMGRVDDLPDAVALQESRKPLGSSEPADMHGNRLSAGVGHASRIGQKRRPPRLGDGLCQPARFGGAAQDEGGSDV